MLADRAKINLRAGHGGSGCVSFRRERYVPRGGPDGGDGARGGDVVLVATRQVADLRRFRQQHHFRAANGGHGRGALRRGADGEDQFVEVPVGTEVRDEQGQVLADLALEGQRAVLAVGGEGGRGNVCFATSTRQSPRFAERGLPGTELWVELRLKLLADVGLVGLPNAGKSSLLVALTRARPKVAAYPFTTIEPNLGVLTSGERRIVLADIPGLIEGASVGVGLGDRFLAHVERTSVLVYVVDGSERGDAVEAALTTVRAELVAYEPELGDRPAVVAVNKCDLLAAADVDAVLDAAAATAEALPHTGRPLAISADTGVGLTELTAAIVKALDQWRLPVAPSAPVVLRPDSNRAGDFHIESHEGQYRVVGAGLERLVAKADLGNEEAVRYIQEVMEKAGVSVALRRAGALPGDTVVIGDVEFEFS
ncbi:MAG: GTPase ObgE [Thermoleophilia bacterium]